MEMRNRLTRLSLRARESILLEDAAGMEVIAQSGRIWLTQYGDSRDIVLTRGRSFVITLPSCLVMSGGEEADFLLRPAEPRSATPRTGWLRWVAGLLDPRWSGAVHRALEGRTRVHRAV